MILGQLIFAWRKYHGISIRDAAKQIGVETSALYRFEKGDSAKIKFSNICRLIAWALSREEVAKEKA